MKGIENMTVREFAKNNTTTEILRIRTNGKVYMCSLIEAILIFGEKNIKRISKNDDLVILSVK